MNPMFDSTTKTGTASGTLLTVFANISEPDVSKTILLAGIGAVVSFIVTVILKLLYKRFKK